MEHLIDFVKELSFVRVGGSPQEKQAAELILQKVREISASARRNDIHPKVLPFQIPDADVKKCVVTAAGREISSTPFLCSGNIDRECRLLYLDDATEIDSARDASLYPKELREQYRRNGVIPGFWITAADAAALLNEEVETIHLTLEQEEKAVESQNLLVELKGTDRAEESIVLTAHYDSVPVGTGSWDNATGATALLAIFDYFVAHPSRRTLLFLWCGSEEKGLLGSRAFGKVLERCSIQRFSVLLLLRNSGTGIKPWD